MKPEIVCALITLAGTVLSSVIAWLVSRSSAVKEIEKLRLEWEREDIVTSDDEFSKMASAVSLYIQTQKLSDWNTAVERISGVRAKENGEFAAKLDNLYFEIRSGYTQNIDRTLSEVIEEKRKCKGKNKIPKK